MSSVISTSYAYFEQSPYVEMYVGEDFTWLPRLQGLNLTISQAYAEPNVEIIWSIESPIVYNNGEPNVRLLNGNTISPTIIFSEDYFSPVLVLKLKSVRYGSFRLLNINTNSGEEISLIANKTSININYTKASIAVPINDGLGGIYTLGFKPNLSSIVPIVIESTINTEKALTANNNGQQLLNQFYFYSSYESNTRNYISLNSGPFQHFPISFSINRNPEYPSIVAGSTIKHEYLNITSSSYSPSPSQSPFFVGNIVQEAEEVYEVNYSQLVTLENPLASSSPFPFFSFISIKDFSTNISISSINLFLNISYTNNNNSYVFFSDTIIT